MRTKFNKLTDSNAATLFLFGYGLIIQIVAFAVINFFISYYPVTEPFIEAFVLLWYCIPVIAVFSIIIAVMQLKKRIPNRERHKKPLVGLILNSVWLLCYFAVIYLVFVVKLPLFFTK